MWLVYRQAGHDHAFACDADGGRILGAIARRLPGEVATICDNGTTRHLWMTTRDELAAAVRTVLACLDADPKLLFRYAVTMEVDPKPSAGQFGRGTALSGVRLADTPADRAYVIDCGPGHCDLKEVAIGTDGRGTVVGLTDLRGRVSVETANVGSLRLHRRASKTGLRGQLADLLAAAEGWPPGPVSKSLRVAGGADGEAEPDGVLSRGDF